MVVQILQLGRRREAGLTKLVRPKRLETELESNKEEEKRVSVWGCDPPPPLKRQRGTGQGYLAHKKMPNTLGYLKDPGHVPTVGS